MTDGKVCAGSGHHAFFDRPAVAKQQWNAACDYQENFAPLRGEQTGREPTIWGRTGGGWWDSLCNATFASTDMPASWSRGLVFWLMFCILVVETSKCGQFKRYGDLCSKSYHWSRVISEKMCHCHISKTLPHPISFICRSKIKQIFEKQASIIFLMKWNSKETQLQPKNGTLTRYFFSGTYLIH